MGLKLCVSTVKSHLSCSKREISELELGMKFRKKILTRTKKLLPCALILLEGDEQQAAQPEGALLGCLSPGPGQHTSMNLANQSPPFQPSPLSWPEA